MGDSTRLVPAASCLSRHPPVARPPSVFRPLVNIRPAVRASLSRDVMERSEQNRRASVEAIIVGSRTVPRTLITRMPRWIIVTIICYALSLSPGFVHSREADDRSQFLYADDPRAVVILEYQLHNAPTKDYTIEGHNMDVEYDEERHIRPYFLNSDNGRRVVHYYSPWCG